MDTEKISKGQLTLLPLGMQDLTRVTELQPSDWPDITVAYNKYLNWKSWCFPKKLVYKNYVVGIGNIIHFGNSAWLSQIIVDQNFRGQGLGKFLTQQLINEIKNEVQTISLLATEDGHPVYRKLGFADDVVYNFYRNEIEIEALELDASFTVMNELNEEVYAFDQEVTLESRRKLLDANQIGARYYYHQKELIACHFPELGDGWLISKDQELGKQLLIKQYNRKHKISFPQSNETAMDLLYSAGILPYRFAMRMYLGKKINFKGEWIYSRIGGNLG